MLWDQRVVGSNPISPTTFPNNSSASAASPEERNGNDRTGAAPNGHANHGIVPDGVDTVAFDHPLTTIPAHDDWGGWVETWCRDDTGNIDCVPYFMRAGIADDVTPEGWLKLPCDAFKTPYTLARWVYGGDHANVRPPWMGTGMSPFAVKAQWLQMIQDVMDRSKPKPPIKKAWVKPVPGAHLYFIESAAGPIKIGVSSDPAQRLKGLQTSHPFKLRILAVVQNAGAKECEYHRHFDEHRLEGEWFTPHPDILAEIARLNGASHV